MHFLPRVLVATSNHGKLRDFAGAAREQQVTIGAIADFEKIPAAVESGETFEQNARIKAEHYSKFAAGEWILADDSGLVVDALGGAPGVHSARYGALLQAPLRHPTSGLEIPIENCDDALNNRVLISELIKLPEHCRQGHFECVIAIAKTALWSRCFAGPLMECC